MPCQATSQSSHVQVVTETMHGTMCAKVQVVVMLKSVAMLQEGADFRTAADRYVRHFLSKGIPSLFSDLKSFYR